MIYQGVVARTLPLRDRKRVNTWIGGLGSLLVENALAAAIGIVNDRIGNLQDR
jgi:hypothetical protein